MEVTLIGFLHKNGKLLCMYTFGNMKGRQCTSYITSSQVSVKGILVRKTFKEHE